MTNRVTRIVYNEDITGQKFNMLTAIKFSHKDKSRNHYWLVSCECGKEKIITRGSLRSGNSRSCGCYQLEKVTTHGLTKTSEYETWGCMKQRCLNPNVAAYKNYGGRGIKICDRWLNSFPNFLEDMRNKPTSKHSIDRIDNDGDYEPSNCRWSTKLEQANNKRTSINITFKNETKTLAQWCQLLKLNYNMAKWYYRKGLPLQKIVDKIS